MSFLETTRPREGLRSRRVILGLLAALLLWGGLAFGEFLDNQIPRLQQPLTAIGDTVITYGRVIGLLVGLVLIYGGILALNRANTATLLVETDQELEKVEWPSRPQTWRSTWVVVAFVFILGLYLFVVDLGFQQIAHQVFGGVDSSTP